MGDVPEFGYWCGDAAVEVWLPEWKSATQEGMIRFQPVDDPDSLEQVFVRCALAPTNIHPPWRPEDLEKQPNGKIWGKTEWQESRRGRVLGGLAFSASGLTRTSPPDPPLDILKHELFFDISQHVGAAAFGQLRVISVTGQPFDGLDPWRLSENTTVTRRSQRPDQQVATARFQTKWLAIDAPTDWRVDSEVSVRGNFGPPLQFPDDEDDQDIDWDRYEGFGVEISVSEPAVRPSLLDRPALLAAAGARSSAHLVDWVASKELGRDIEACVLDVAPTTRADGSRIYCCRLAVILVEIGGGQSVVLRVRVEAKVFDRFTEFVRDGLSMVRAG